MFFLKNKTILIAAYVLSLHIILPGISFAETEREIAIERFSVNLSVSFIGSKEVEALLINDNLYLSVTEVFNFLKVKNTTSKDRDSIYGFFITPGNNYIISENKIITGNKTYHPDPEDIIVLSDDIYMKSGLFGEIFGLYSEFIYRSLTVSIKTAHELPAIRERRQEMLRNNLKKLNKEPVSDVFISRDFTFFNAGTLDWMIINQSDRHGINNTFFRSNIGTTIAGGEATLNLSHTSTQKLMLRQQLYQWKRVDNENIYLRQVTAGKFGMHSYSSFSTPLTGINLTNKPTRVNKIFDTYKVSDITEPGWIVELYINNILIDYTHADASGYFSFEIPLLYGATNVKLKHTGPWGEEKITEKKYSIPFTFIQPGVLYYDISGGISDNPYHNYFTRGDLKYGVTRKLTIGTGVEYLNSVNNLPAVPFADISYRLAPGLVLSSVYLFNVKSSGTVNFRLKNDLICEVTYNKFEKNQKNIMGTMSEEKYLLISKPISVRNFNIFTKLYFKQITFPSFVHSTSALFLSGAVAGVATNISTEATYIDNSLRNVYSNYSLSFRMPYKIIIKPVVQYNYSAGEFREWKIEIEKRIVRNAGFTFSYNDNLKYKVSTYNFGFRYDFSFARTSVFIRQQSSGDVLFTQTLSGGLSTNTQADYFHLNTHRNVGRGGIILYSYLDLNGNNRRDEGEPDVEGLKVRSGSGRIIKSTGEMSYKIIDLEPYTNCFIDLSQSSFDNISWQLVDKTYNITVEPNRMKIVEIPVRVLGEISGNIYHITVGDKGIGRILVNFYKDGVLFGSAMTENDGYYNFLGFPPGNYTAVVDKVQLDKIKMSAIPESIEFQIMESTDGEEIFNADFRLYSL